MGKRGITTFEKAYPRNVVTDRFCMYIKCKLCLPERLSFGELMPESINNENTEIITNGNKNDIHEYVDGDKVTITVKGKGIDPYLQQVMYKGYYKINIYEEEANDTSGTQVIQPECWSPDPDCPDNCVLLCEQFCEPPTITVIECLGKEERQLLPGASNDYIIQRDECNTHWYIRFMNPDANPKSKIKIEYDGTVGKGWSKVRTDCDSPKPFVMKLEARSGACGGNNYQQILLTDVIAKPMSITTSTDNGTKVDYMVELVGRVKLEGTQRL